VPPVALTRLLEKMATNFEHEMRVIHGWWPFVPRYVE